MKHLENTRGGKNSPLRICFILLGNRLEFQSDFGRTRQVGPTNIQRRKFLWFRPCC